MRLDRLKVLFKKFRNFVLCCKKTVNEVDSVVEDIEDLQWFDNPIYKPKEDES